MEENKRKGKKTATEDNTDKKDRTVSRHLRFALATAVVLLSILGISAAFMTRVYLNTESACYEDLAVETEDAIAELEANIRSDRTMLRIIAGHIGSADDLDSIEVSGHLSNYDVNSLITQSGILLPENVIVSPGGRRSNAEGVLDYAQLEARGEHISASRSVGSDSNAMMLRNYVPIRHEGRCIGMLFSAARSSNVAKAWVPEIYNKEGYCYVVDRKTGDVIVNTSSDSTENINDISFRQTDPSCTKEGTVSNILGGKKGYSVFGTGNSGESIYMCYLPFEIEDWEMVAFVPESAVFQAVAPIRKELYSLIVIVIVIMAVYALWLAREIRLSIADTEQRANIDALTGLQNRNRYELYLKELETAKDNVTCLFIDANGLHDLNNSKGHFAGDQMLRFIADTLKVQFGGENIYRIGGDEFVVFSHGMTEDELNVCLDSFHEALQRNDYHAAVGTCVYGFEMSVDDLIRNAEKEMYEAKRKYYEQIGKIMRI